MRQGNEWHQGHWDEGRPPASEGLGVSGRGWDTGSSTAALGAVPVGRSRAQLRCKGRVHPTVQARSDLQRSTAFK